MKPLVLLLCLLSLPAIAENPHRVAVQVVGDAAVIVEPPLREALADLGVEVVEDGDYEFYVMTARMGQVITASVIVRKPVGDLVKIEQTWLFAGRSRDVRAFMRGVVGAFGARVLRAG